MKEIVTENPANPAVAFLDVSNVAIEKLQIHFCPILSLTKKLSEASNNGNGK